MDIGGIIGRMRAEFEGFNRPARARDVERLIEAVGPLPPEVVRLYEDHDGAARLPVRGEDFMPVRLMSVKEAIEAQAAVAAWSPGVPGVDDVAWLWADDESNYAGVYRSGELKGWVTKYWHEEPVLTPAYRSVGGFLAAVLDSGPPGDGAETGEAALDVMMVPDELPKTVVDPVNDEADARLAAVFRERCRAETDEEMRVHWALCAMCLTPADRTAEVVEFLRDADEWLVVPRAIGLLAMRGYTGAVEELGRLVREGEGNSVFPARVWLVRMQTAESRVMVERLLRELTGGRLAELKHCIEWEKKWPRKTRWR